MNLIIEPIKNYYDCNTNNIKSYNPYYIENDILCIDENWYEKLIDISKSRLSELVEYYNLDFQIIKNIFVPHNFYNECKNEKYKEIYASIYKLYISQFDYENWCENKNMLVKFSHQDIDIIIYLIEYAEKITQETIKNFSKNFSQEIKRIMEKYRENKITRFFVKLSGTSGKSQKELRPLFDEIDIIKFITHSVFLQEYNKAKNKIFTKDLYLVILPWNDMFEDKKYEFRCFMFNKKIKCVSSQLWYDNPMYNEKDMEIIKNVFCNYKDKSIYQDAVIDVYIKDNILHVIEYNPFGPYSSSCSSLFNWTKDYNKIHNDYDDIYFRYIE